MVGLGWVRGKEFCFIAFPWLEFLTLCRLVFFFLQISFIIKAKNLKSFITTGNLKAKETLSTLA